MEKQKSLKSPQKKKKVIKKRLGQNVDRKENVNKLIRKKLIRKLMAHQILKSTRHIINYSWEKRQCPFREIQ